MRAIFVGRSVVSAITQTPASGPFVLVTTPPISSLSMRGALPPCAVALVIDTARNAASARPSTPRDKVRLFIVAPSCLFLRLRQRRGSRAIRDFILKTGFMTHVGRGCAPRQAGRKGPPYSG